MLTVLGFAAELLYSFVLTFLLGALTFLIGAVVLAIAARGFTSTPVR